MVTGTGTQLDPYMLYNLSDLEQVATLGLDKYYKLANDIDATGTGDPGYNGGAGFVPIGNSSTQFTGNFNGDNKKIIGLVINRPTTNEVGLFGRVKGTVINVILEKNEAQQGHITGQNSTGGIVGYVNSGGDSNISNNTVKIPITGYTGVGGIVGSTANDNNILNCNYNLVDTVITGNDQVGGIIGISLLRDNNATNFNYNTVHGTINVTASYMGGILGNGCGCGLRYNTVNNLTLNASATSNYIGGISGGVYYIVNVDQYIDHNNVQVNVTGQDYIGGLSGGANEQKQNLFNVTNNVYEGIITGRSYIGGLVGVSRYTDDASTIQYNTVNATINATGNYVGGVAGIFEKNMRHMVLDNIIINVSATSNYVGGAVGAVPNAAYSDGWFEDIIITDIQISGQDYIGGLIGQVETGSHGFTVDNCIVKGIISGRNYIGGLIGYEGFNSGSYIRKSYTEGTVNSTGQYSGGLVGQCRCNIQNSYSFVTVNGVNTVGGLVGRQEISVITNCYSKGHVTGTTSVGGLVGSINTGSQSNCFWDTQTSGQSTSALGTGKTTLQMKNILTYLPNWNFDTIWYIDNLNNYGYPLILGVTPSITILFNYFRGKFRVLETVIKRFRGKFEVIPEKIRFRAKIDVYESAFKRFRSRIKILPITPTYTGAIARFRSKISLTALEKKRFRAKVNIDSGKTRIELFANVKLRQSEFEDSFEDFEFTIGDQKYDT